MTEQGESVEQALLAHAERQTTALENINAALMRALAVLVVIGLVVVIAYFVENA